MTISRVRWRTWWPIVVIALAAGAIYLPGLGRSPAYIGGDEARFATAAASVASTGRDLTGNRLPLFFHMTESLAGDAGTRWYQPMTFYLIALVFRIAPVSEATMRIPSALIGLIDIVLIYFVARRIFGDRLWASIAAAMLALSPAHFIFSRQALDYICPLPFVLAWLWCTLAAVESGSVALSLAAGLLLGVGFYSYIAAWIMMPLLLLLTWAAQRQAHNPLRTSLAAAIGCAGPVLIVIPWLWSHPEMWRDMVSRYNMYDARHLTPLQGARDYLNYNNVQERLSVYWDYFNPAFLFFSGGSNLTTATRRAGVFLVPAAVFIVCGIYDLLQRRRSAVTLLLLGGLAASPLPATFVDERYAIQRALFVLPFGVLIATTGAVFLLRHRNQVVRLAAVALALAMPIQYAYFARDYFGDYRIRSAYWFDPANLRGVAEYLMASAREGQAPLMYLNENLDDVAPRWRFYLIKHRREDLIERSRLFAAKDLDMRQVPAGSLIVFYANDPIVPTLLSANTCAVATYVTDIAGRRTAVILRKSV